MGKTSRMLLSVVPVLLAASGCGDTVNNQVVVCLDGSAADGGTVDAPVVVDATVVDAAAATDSGRQDAAVDGVMAFEEVPSCAYNAYSTCCNRSPGLFTPDQGYTVCMCLKEGRFACFGDWDDDGPSCPTSVVPGAACSPAAKSIDDLCAISRLSLVCLCSNGVWACQHNDD